MKAAPVVLALLALAPLRAQGDEGPALYATYCASCHGARGQGSPDAPPLIGKPAVDVHFMLDSGRMPAPAPSVNEIPRQPRFSQAQIAEIVRYVLSFSPVRPNDALPHVVLGDATRGRELFAANCAQCHGAAGDGASVGAADVAPDLSTASIFQVGEAVRAGPGVMPRFGPRVLRDRDVDDIAAYIDLVRTRANEPKGIDAGGFPLAHVGPVAEGIVAWFFGLGALVLFARRVGTAGKDR